MKKSLSLKILSCVIVVIFPASVFGADAGPTAMLYARGATTLNGNGVPRTSALFPGDLVQTGADSVANINATGSTILILSDSLVQYQNNVVKLEHGGVTISTSKSMTTRSGGVSVSPSANVLTEFEVRDVDGKVQIAARKGALTISDGTSTSTLAQGQETTRDESASQQEESQKDKKSKRRETGATAPAASGGLLNSPWAIGIGAAAVAGVSAWALIQGDEPASPTR